MPHFADEAAAQKNFALQFSPRMSQRPPVHVGTNFTPLPIPQTHADKAQHVSATTQYSPRGTGTAAATDPAGSPLSPRRHLQRATTQLLPGEGGGGLADDGPACGQRLMIKHTKSRPDLMRYGTIRSIATAHEWGVSGAGPIYQPPPQPLFQSATTQPGFSATGSAKAPKPQTSAAAASHSTPGPQGNNPASAASHHGPVIIDSRPSLHPQEFVMQANIAKRSRSAPARRKKGSADLDLDLDSDDSPRKSPPPSKGKALRLPRPHDGMSFCSESTTDVTGATVHFDSFDMSSPRKRKEVEDYMWQRRRALVNHIVDGRSTRIDHRSWNALVEKYMHGGHYSYIVGPLNDKDQNESQRALDEELMAMLHNKGPMVAPAYSMRTAFTDRSVRMREGLHGQDVFGGGTTPREEISHSDGCDYSLYHGYDWHPAGIHSHTFPQNKVKQLHAEPPHASVEEMDPSKWLNRNSSSSITKVIHEHNDDPAKRLGEIFAEEKLFGKHMGRKIKQAPEYSEICDGRLRAGNYNKEFCGLLPTRLGRQEGQPNNEDMPQRQDMHMIMTPQARDPAPCPQITPAKKGAGDCRTPSDICEAHSLVANKDIFRYEMMAFQEQQRSLSPRTRTSWTSSERNPVNHAGWDESPRRQRRAAPSRPGSLTAAQIGDQIDALHQAGEERTQRLKTDKHFADICSHTDESKISTAESVASFQSRTHHSVSTSMSMSLSWAE